MGFDFVNGKVLTVSGSTAYNGYSGNIPFMAGPTIANVVSGSLVVRAGLIVAVTNASASAVTY